MENNPRRIKNKKWDIKIPTKEELNKIIQDDNICEVELATNKDGWNITLYLDADSNNQNITGTVEISIADKLWEEPLKTQLGDELIEKLAECFSYGTRRFTEVELYWILPSAVQECIAYIENLKNIIQKNIFKN